MDMNNFLQSEATQFVGTAAANTIGLVTVSYTHLDVYKRQLFITYIYTITAATAGDAR